jgi:hypothetical protein
VEADTAALARRERGVDAAFDKPPVKLIQHSREGWRDKAA